jgi:hypothetical protein
MPFGSDVLTFHGSSAGFVRQRPQLLLTAVGEGPEVPIPSPAPPTGGPGSVMASNATALELSCDGGATLLPVLVVHLRARADS